MANRLSRDTMLTQAIWALRAFYLLGSLSILIVRLIPAFADRFLAYGARARPEQAGGHDNEEPPKQNQPSVGIKFLDYLATFTVPHSWFMHFYILSLACSFASLCIFYVYEEPIKQSQKLDIAAFCSHLMFLQGLRRLLECIYLNQNSTSRMWLGHYAIGMAFYFVTNMAIWVEHFNFDPPQTHQPPAVASGPEQSSILWTWRTVLCTLVFFAASDKQNYYHRYLSSLEKYTLPDKHAFQYIVAPHYMLECVIYLSLAILDAPLQPQALHRHDQRPAQTIINWTLFCALTFVAVNLGVTAAGTKDWLRTKFRDESYEIMKRWKMIPLLY